MGASCLLLAAEMLLMAFEISQLTPTITATPRSSLIKKANMTRKTNPRNGTAVRKNLLWLMEED